MNVREKRSSVIGGRLTGGRGNKEFFIPPAAAATGGVHEFLFEVSIKEA